MKATWRCAVAVLLVAGLGVTAWAEDNETATSADGDGWKSIRFGYAKRYSLERFQEADTDADGHITLEEAKAAKLPWDIVRSRAYWKNADSDDDGQLSLNEFQAARTSQLNRLRRRLQEADGRLAERLKAGGIDQAEANQITRIRNGIRSGALTPDEAEELLTGEREIRKTEREMKSDGEFSKEERAQLRDELKQMSGAIRTEKHDDEQAEGRTPKATPGATARQENQRDRIQQGVRSGELTGKEVEKLRDGQQQVREIKKDAKEDGKVTVPERKHIHRAQNKQSQAIRREKHDAQKRPSARRGKR